MRLPWNRHRDDQQEAAAIADLRAVRRRAEAVTDRLERLTEQFARALDEDLDKPRKPGEPWTPI